MLVQPRVEFILSFIHHIAEDEDHTDAVVANAAGLIGKNDCNEGGQSEEDYDDVE